MTAQDILLDTTRLVSRAWTKRRSTGIDRVCEAYARYFHARARAVVQHRGMVKVFNRRDSDAVFDMLLQPSSGIRSKLVRFSPLALTRSPSRIPGDGMIYINPSHTDFDLPTHHQWVEKSNLRSVYFLHDLIPLTHPRLSSAHAVRRHLGRVRGLLRHGSGAIVNTSATQAQLAKFAEKRGLDLPPIAVAPLAGADFTNRPYSQTEKAQRFEAHKPYFLCIGTIERRKNYELLFRVWDELIDAFGDSCPRLVIVGQDSPQSAPVMEAYRSRPRLAKVVRFDTAANDSQIGALLAGSRALLMPTHAEGYGLPVVEALQHGTPVIANDIPSFQEIGQGIPLLLDVADETAWKRAICRFAFSDSERDRQLNMMEHFIAPTWQNHFAIIDSWLEGLASAERVPNERLQVEC
ncbi:glycosyltransferase family 1 protein [uncultured Erythrobacter sp.]|uniref:glycosyltransferase family 4 protein n=1 Tax=uncultured Erythrobacter sp. TaxID=263913 RepID=UPI00260E4BDE|nr:glycosyltransferase family 1 protein [uncultured Erythrobacter sp.]